MNQAANWRRQVFGTDRPVALVTGSGAPRVGNVIARELAACGYAVAIHANTNRDEAEATVEELVANGLTAACWTADLTDERAATQLIDQVATHWGRLDVLVNSAAMWRPVPLEEVTVAEVRRNLELNLIATFVCARQAGLKMVAQSTGGAIVNIGDWAVARPYRDYAAYFCSKGSIPTLTRDLAVELASRNPRVRVNAVLPGPVMLPTDLPQEVRAAAIAGTLLKREGSPLHVARAVLSLIENDFITGVCLPVDGGRTIASGDGA